MAEVKKPSMVSPVLVTTALVSCLISLLLTIVSSNYSRPVILFQVLTIALVMTVAIINWRVYCKAFVAFEVQKQLYEKGKVQ